MDADAVLGGIVIDEPYDLIFDDLHTVNVSQQSLAGITGSDNEESLEPACLGCAKLFVIKPDYHSQSGKDKERPEHISHKHPLADVGYVPQGLPNRALSANDHKKPQAHNDQCAYQGCPQNAAEV